jgi:hypothetical protein
MISQTKTIWQLPSMSQDFIDGPQVLMTRNSVTIKYDYETSTGESQWASMVFRGVFGFAFTTHRTCSVEQIRSYDTLVELESSDWVIELLSRWPDVLERPVVTISH